jgi:hypothetical protein
MGPGPEIPVAPDLDLHEDAAVIAEPDPVRIRLGDGGAVAFLHLSAGTDGLFGGPFELVQKSHCFSSRWEGARCLFGRFFELLFRFLDLFFIPRALHQDLLCEGLEL